MEAALRVAWLALALLGCGGSQPLGDDAGVADGGADASPVTPAPPEIPWLHEDGTVELPPRLVPCPDGWREVLSETGVATCDPYPAGGPSTCPEGQAHFPGEPGCAPIGSPCPAGEFAEGLPDDGTVLFVLAGAPTGGDGTRGRPFGRIADALAGAGPGRIVALGRGRYEELLTLGAGVTLAGACAGASTVAFSGPDPRPAVLTVAGADVTLRDLTIGTSDRPGIVVRDPGTELRIEGVLIDRTTTFGMVVRDGARLTAQGLVVRETLSYAGGAAGRGLEVERGATAEVSRALFERNREIGVLVHQEGTTLRLTDAVVRDTQSQESDLQRGQGLSVQLGAAAEVSRALFERNRATGIIADGAGTTLVLADVVVRDTQGQTADRAGGRGLDVQTGAGAEVSRAVFERNRFVGIFAHGAGTTLALTDVVVRDTESQESDLMFGRGLHVQIDAAAEVSRALFEQNRDAGIVVSESARVTLTDVVVRDTRSQESDLGFGRGLDVEARASVAVSRALFERNRDVGIYAGQPGTTLIVADAVVRDTRSQENNLMFGRAIDVEAAASVEVSRALFERNREISLLAIGTDTRLVLTDAIVRDTARDDTGLGGIGVGSHRAASLLLTRFVVTGSALAGVQLARDGTVDLHEGEVSHNAIGANVQTSGFDFERLRDRVVYRDNVRDLAADELPVPDGALPAEGP